MIKKYIIVFAALIFLVVAFRDSVPESINSDNERLAVRVVPFRTTAGWGYDIEVDGKAFIHQDYVPAIQGKKCFNSPEDALKVGELVLKKMKDKKRPVITVDELKGLQIKYY